MVIIIADTLRKLRKGCNYTQQQVADSLGIDRSTYSYYETAKTMPDIKTIIKLSKIFNVPYTDILEEEEEFTVMNSGEFRPYIDNILKQNKASYSHVYELSTQERELILNFRLLTDDDREKFLKELEARLDEKKED